MPEEDEAAASAETVCGPPVPPPPPPVFCPPPPVQSKSKFFKTIADKSDPSVGGCVELKRPIMNQQKSTSIALMPEEDEAAATDTICGPPVPPPPPPVFCPPPPVQSKSKFFKTIADKSDPSVGGCEELKRLIMNQQERFGGNVKWLLYNRHITSLIQDGPQCGLVALWMAGGLLSNKQEVTLDYIVQVATSRGYTIHGEMFSADNMSCLAEEVFGCQCDLLTGGMEGENRERILGQVTAGLPVLIPYDEDFNHEPCKRDGHRAHWAVISDRGNEWSRSMVQVRSYHNKTSAIDSMYSYNEDFNHEPCQRDGHWAHLPVISGALLGMQNGSFNSDPEIPRLFQPPSSPSALNTGDIEQIYLIAKQGKSLRYQLWEYGLLSRSNNQLLHLDPKRTCDGNVYVVPAGGVQAGLCGKVLLLKQSEQ